MKLELNIFDSNDAYVAFHYLCSRKKSDYGWENRCVELRMNCKMMNDLSREPRMVPIPAKYTGEVYVNLRGDGNVGVEWGDGRCETGALSSKFRDVSRNTALSELNCSANRLSAETLNDVFARLHDMSEKKKTVNIADNTGMKRCNAKIARNKGWIIID